MRARSRKKEDPLFSETWKLADRPCIPCRRSIQRGDGYRWVEVYVGNERTTIPVHRDCREVRDRSVLDAAAIRQFLEASSQGRGTMAEETQVQEEQQEQPAAEETKTPAKKARKGKKAKAGKNARVPKSIPAKAETEEKPAKKAKKGKKGGAKKATAKATKKEKTSSRSSLAQSVGQTLTTLLKGNRNVGSTVKALAKGDEVSNADLVALKAEINAVAAKHRENGKKSEASQLSSANRLVRRLERASR